MHNECKQKDGSYVNFKYQKEVIDRLLEHKAKLRSRKNKQTIKQSLDFERSIKCNKKSYKKLDKAKPVNFRSFYDKEMIYEAE